ncbi:MAG TPA: caspase family protein [Geminicoccaceae bacterium]|nr:caspase family protein [Geminicoccaceae bacterium]
MRVRQVIVRRLGAGLALLMVTAAVPPDAAAQGSVTRFAVVVGNGAYQQRPLPNPVNDARSVSSVLREVGFEVFHVENASAEELRRMAAAIRERFHKDGVGLFYYAGHAVQYQGTNYLLPTDFQAGGADELVERGLPADAVLGAMDAAGVKLSIVVLDACRDNPFGDPSGAFGPGLAVMERARGETLVAYATAAGDVAEDGFGANSPFTAAFVSALEQPGKDILDVFKRVRSEVREATEGRQLPWVSGSLESDFVFRPVESEPPPLPEPEDDEDITLASILWEAIRRSVDPFDFEQFLALGQDSPYVDLAQQRLRELRSRGYQPAPPVVLKPEGAYPELRGGLGESVTECDIAATDPQDPQRIADPVEWGLVNTRLAVRVCGRDLARDPDNPRLMFQLGRALDIAGHYEQARHLYEQAIARGYSAAMVNLGYMILRGRLGATDDARTAELYRQAGDLGNLRARTNLGRLYLEGRGVPKSELEGAIWTRLAASNGWANAIDQLGNFYLNGRGVPQSDSEAFAQYERAAMLGSSNAMNNLARMYRDGRGVEKDLVLAVAWYEKAIERGNQYAPQALANLHLKGEGVPRDPARAMQLLRRAAERGFADALVDIGRLYESGEEGGPDPDAAYFHYAVAELAKARNAGERKQALAPKLAVGRRDALQAEAAQHFRDLGAVPRRS